MAKNSLQAQLLKAGLIDSKKAKKLNKQAQHQQRLGQEDNSLKAELAQANQQKIAKDRALNQEKQRLLDEKTLKNSIEQMIQQHQLKDTQGDISYQFMDGQKIKKVYISQQIYNALVKGTVVIARTQTQEYAYLPYALAQRIEQKMTGFLINFNQSIDQNNPNDDEDPYANYVIPDDLMW